MMAMLTLIFSCAMVASSHMVIWKPPSPTTTHTSDSGLANFAPIAAGRAKPLVPRPPEGTHPRGRLWGEYCAHPHSGGAAGGAPERKNGEGGKGGDIRGGAGHKKK